MLIVDSVIPSGNAAHFGKLLDLEMLALTPRGRERTQAEFRDLLKRSGFKLDRVIPTEIHLSLVEARGHEKLSRRNNLTGSNPVACSGKANPGRKILWTICRISVRPFDQIVKEGNSARPKTVTGEIMPQYLVAIHHPDDYDPSVQDEAVGRDIDVLNEEITAAGIRVLVDGLHPVRNAKSLRAQPGGKVLITDGP